MIENGNLQYPQALKNDFLALFCRYGMTPTCISSILMYVILPAKYIYTQEKQGKAIDTRINLNENSKNYVIYFGGNSQDCVNAGLITDSEVTNIVLWNYPGVGNSQLASHSPEDLYRAGYAVVKKYIDEGIEPKCIKLHGYSLGGNVASEVARRLHRDGHYVHLFVDRSFSSVSAVVPEMINNLNNNMLRLSISSLLGMSALVLMVSGLPGSIINTMTLIVMNICATTGYVLAFTIQGMGILLQKSMNKLGCPELGAFLAFSFRELGFFINQMMNFVSQSINDLTWWIVGVVSVVALIPMLLAGVVLGLICISILSLQLFWTDNPNIFPTYLLIEGALLVNSCSMNSVQAIQEMIELDGKKQGQIIIHNTNLDDIIYPEASLCAGLGFYLNMPNDEQQSLTGAPVCEWYYGNHSIKENKLTN